MQKKEETIINIARDFSKSPGGRFRKFGPKSGEEFRERLLKLLKKYDVVTVTLNGVEGYGSSFLEEAFGGLVRLGLYSEEELKRRLIISSGDEYYLEYEKEAKSYIEDAFSRNRQR